MVEKEDNHELYMNNKKCFSCADDLIC